MRPCLFNRCFFCRRAITRDRRRHFSPSRAMQEISTRARKAQVGGTCRGRRRRPRPRSCGRQACPLELRPGRNGIFFLAHSLVRSCASTKKPCKRTDIHPDTGFLNFLPYFALRPIDEETGSGQKTEATACRRRCQALRPCLSPSFPLSLRSSLPFLMEGSRIWRPFVRHNAAGTGEHQRRLRRALRRRRRRRRPLRRRRRLK